MLLVEMSSSKQEHEPIHTSLSEGLSFKTGNTKKTVTALMSCVSGINVSI